MRRHLRQELITEEELMSQLRQQGVQNLAEVKRCYLEGDGHFSVIAGPSKSFRQRKTKKRLHEPIQDTALCLSVLHT